MQPRVTAIVVVAGSITAAGLPRLPAVALRCAHLTRWVTAAGPDVVATEVAAALLWALAAWVTACYLLVLGCRLPGLPGCIARRVARVAVPQMLLRLAAGSAGLGIVLAPVAAASAAAPVLSAGPGGPQVVKTAAATPDAVGREARSDRAQRGPQWPSATAVETRPRAHPRTDSPTAGSPTWPASRATVSRTPVSRTPVSHASVSHAPGAHASTSAPAWPTARSSASQADSTPNARPTAGAGRPTSGARPGGSSTGAGATGSTTGERPTTGHTAGDPTTGGTTTGHGTAARGAAGTAVGTSVVVDPGDSLWLLAARRLGPDATTREIARYWPRLYRANRSVVGTDPALLHPGERLAVPPPRADPGR